MLPAGIVTGLSANVTSPSRSSSRIVPFQGRITCSEKISLPTAADRAPVVIAAVSISTTDVAPAAASNRHQKATPAGKQQQKNLVRSTVSRQRAAQGSTKTVKPKPYLIRVAGRTSSIQQAAGAAVKRLETEEMVRVAAIDPESLPKAMLVLTAANNMSQGNSGRMLVFQPTLISKTAAEPPSIPVGSMVMYTSQIMAGEVLASNLLRATATTDYKRLARAIIARVEASSHTVLECYGSLALAVAVQAVAQARKGLLVRGQDAACVLTSTRKVIPNPELESSEAEPPAPALAGDSSNGSNYPATCHRLVVLECEQRRPRALLVRSAVGRSDRAAAAQQHNPAPSS